MANEVWISGGESTTVNAVLLSRLEKDPDSEYLDINGVKVSAADVHDTACRFANTLIGLGVEPGDRVATLIENSIEGALAWWGIVFAGAVAVPINTAYKGQYLRHQLHDSGAKVLVVQEDLTDRVGAIIAELPDLSTVTTLGAEAPEMAGTRTMTWSEVLSADATDPGITVRPVDLGTFVYTGGTTGPSKGCMLSHNSHGALARQIGICWERTADDVVWTPLPLFHFNAITTAVLGPLVWGGRAAIYNRFSVSNFWPEMNRVGATVTSTLGTMAYLLAHDV